jgi:hypothetical protein
MSGSLHALSTHKEGPKARDNWHRKAELTCTPLSTLTCTAVTGGKGHEVVVGRWSSVAHGLAEVGPRHALQVAVRHHLDHHCADGEEHDVPRPVHVEEGVEGVHVAGQLVHAASPRGSRTTASNPAASTAFATSCTFINRR